MMTGRAVAKLFIDLYEKKRANSAGPHQTRVETRVQASASLPSSSSNGDMGDGVVSFSFIPFHRV